MMERNGECNRTKDVEVRNPIGVVMEPLGDWISDCPWNSRKVVITLTGGVGEDRQAISLTEKRELLSRGDGTMLVFWPGQWSSSVRPITQAERAVVLQALNR